MKRMGIEAQYRKPNTSKRGKRHKIYPYLLRHLTINRPNHVWAMGITYIPMASGFDYLCAVVDQASRTILPHRVSISTETDFCLEALEEAFGRCGRSGIINTDQRSQFTSEASTQKIRENTICISMDGKGCWRDNVFVERVWRSIKYEEVYLHTCDSASEAKAALSVTLICTTVGARIRMLDTKTPDEFCHGGLPAMQPAA